MAGWWKAVTATDEEVRLLADLRSYRERHPYHPETGATPPSDLLTTARILPAFESGRMAKPD